MKSINVWYGMHDESYLLSCRPCQKGYANDAVFTTCAVSIDTTPLSIMTKYIPRHVRS